MGLGLSDLCHERSERKWLVSEVVPRKWGGIRSKEVVGSLRRPKDLGAVSF